MDKKQITGIQQIGVGVKDIQAAFKWYRRVFGMDVPAFDEKAVAELMLPYTGGESRERHAILALNFQGGGGFEIWQHTGKKPKAIDFEAQLGDLGIFAAKMKTADLDAAYGFFDQIGLDMLSKPAMMPSGKRSFFLYDPYGNIFQFVEEQSIYEKTKAFNGGVFGALIGVSDIDKSLVVYRELLEYDKVLYDETALFDDLATLPGGKQKVRRVLLAHSEERSGSFAPFFGPSQIELVQVLDRTPRKLYEGRMWGDPGFIHLCFDVIGIDALQKEAEAKGFSFTVDSARSFDMGEAAGHFVYISDPDGTPIEFVETHKLPIIKKLGWYMNLRGRNPEKSLPRWMINTLKWKRIKDDDPINY